jgi:uncharacterized protein (DUF1330 family)
MKVYYTVTLAMLAGAGLAAVVQSLHAQAKPPVYHIIEIDVSNADGYVKEFLPLVQASVKSAGGRQLAVGGPAGARMNAIEGPLPQSRVSVQVWDSMEKIQVWLNSAAYKDARRVGDKYAKFRSYTIEGLPQ